MTYSTGTDAKRTMCATCQYWHGPREVQFLSCTPTRVRYNNVSAPCAAWKSNRNGACTCNRYKRWVELP
ncbi:MAG: hypothetical protein MJ033_03185 [Victivallaceae bacterium]|nr:hypothetical protein [Victivallaceae bacterium]